MEWKCDKCKKTFEDKDECEKHEGKCIGYNKVKDKCSICGKKIGFFDWGSVVREGKKLFCEDCAKNRKIDNVSVRKMEKLSKDAICSKEKVVKEYKRKCKECGKVWHSLVSREKQLEGGVKCDACVQGATAINGNLGAATQSKRNVDAGQSSLDSLRRCPNCGSQNYKEEVITYEKK